MIRRLICSPLGPPEVSRLPATKRVEGDPEQRLWSQYADASGQFFAGVWESEPGTWRVQYTEEEYCRILEGRSVLTASDGTVTEVGPGDEFVVPRGFVGTWQVVEKTRKTYVIYEAAATDAAVRDGKMTE
ncbi:MAG: cupin domain-containing protein [Sinobacteraceae bacterium]|nr:cupin domain-containing protein [Nevskiaceae bacterium]